MQKWPAFKQQYKPIKNPSEPNLYMFDTIDEDVAFVKSFPAENIWTVIDGEGTTLILIRGFHVIDRIGYIITDVPWTKESCDYEM